MAKPKTQRNEAIWRDLEAGMSRKELCQKYHLKIEGLKSLIHRMRIEKGLLPSAGKIKKVQASKQTSKPAIQQAGKQEKKRPAKKIYDTVTYYIDKETKKKIKILAAQQDKEISQLVREILSDYFDKH